MAAGNWLATNATREYMWDGTFDFKNDSFKVA
ncbi:hypothetical protein LCGC14_2177480, partial [marine sediment metagenome]